MVEVEGGLHAVIVTFRGHDTAPGAEQAVKEYRRGDVAAALVVLDVESVHGLELEHILDDVHVRIEVGGKQGLVALVRHIEHGDGIGIITPGGIIAVFVLDGNVVGITERGDDHTARLRATSLRGRTYGSVVVDGLVEVQITGDRDEVRELGGNVASDDEALHVVVLDISFLLEEVARDIILDSFGTTVDGQVVVVDMTVAENVVNPVGVGGRSGDLCIAERDRRVAVVCVRAVCPHLVVIEIPLHLELVDVRHIVLSAEHLHIRVERNQGIGAVIGHAELAFPSLLRGDEDYAVGCIHTVNGCGCILQDFDGFDVFGIDAGKTCTVDAARHRGHGSAGRTDKGITRHNDAVNDINRRAAAADRNAHTTARLRTLHRCLEAGRTAHEHLVHVGGSHLVNLVGFNLGDSRGQVFPGHGTVAGDDGLVEEVDIVRENDVHNGGSADGDPGGLVADGGELEDIAWFGGDRVATVQVGDGTAALPNDDNASSDYGFTLAVLHLACDVLGERRNGTECRNQQG